MKTQNSNLTFEKRTMRDCYNCKRYETEGECIECHYEPKDEPQYDAEEVAKDINSRAEMTKKEWNARRIEDEPQTERSDK